MLRLTEQHDGRRCTEGRPDAEMMGFRRSVQCAEVISVMRNVVERTTSGQRQCARPSWILPECATACGTQGYEEHGAPQGTQARHRRILARTMRGARGVSTCRLGGGGDYTHRRPQAGLQCQSHAISLVHGRCLSALQQEWAARGCGLQVGDSRVTHICWADDTWLLARSAAGLDWIVGPLEQVARRVVGLKLRLSPCTWARIQRHGVNMPGLRPTESCTNLLRLTELQAGKCLWVLGAYVQSDGRHDAEIVRTAWAAFHARQALWRAPGHLTQNLKVLQMTV